MPYGVVYDGENRSTMSSKGMGGINMHDYFTSPHQLVSCAVVTMTYYTVTRKLERFSKTSLTSIAYWKVFLSDNIIVLWCNVVMKTSDGLWACFSRTEVITSFQIHEHSFDRSPLTFSEGWKMAWVITEIKNTETIWL